MGKIYVGKSKANLIGKNRLKDSILGIYCNFFLLIKDNTNMKALYNIATSLSATPAAIATPIPPKRTAT